MGDREIDAENDEEVVFAARSLQRTLATEVWSRDRCVGRIPPFTPFEKGTDPVGMGDAMNTTAKVAHAPKSPAEVLRELLRSQGGMCQAELARALGVSEARVSLILNEHRPFTPEIALRLQRVFGTPAADWLRFQAEFDLWREEKRLSGEINALPELAA